MEAFTVQTRHRTEFADITELVRKAIRQLGVREGLITVFVPHTTAGITINENADPDVLTDLEAALDRAVPWKADYLHREGNSAAHVKAGMMGSSLQLIVSGGALQLGVWQAVYLAEFDGPRERKVWVA